MTAQSFAFTKIVVADLASSEQFYSRSLGLSRVTYIEFGEGPGELKEVILAVANGAPGGAHLNLIHHPNRPLPTPGGTVLGFMVDDVEATAARMVDLGARITVPVQDVPEHGLKLAFLADPEGHTIEILQTL